MADFVYGFVSKKKFCIPQYASNNVGDKANSGLTGGHFIRRGLRLRRVKGGQGRRRRLGPREGEREQEHERARAEIGGDS